MPKRSAISIRQPWAEQIMRGTKRIEYRSTATKKVNQRVYVYASLIVEDREEKEFRRLGWSRGDLPAGVLIGTIEFSACTGTKGSYEWHIRHPKRLARLRNPQGKPQPV